MPRATPTERALIRRALLNFVNFMRFLHPGPAYAAKFASSTAELGWDGSLLHCKSQGQVVPSFSVRRGKTSLFFRPQPRMRPKSSSPVPPDPVFNLAAD